MPATHFQTLRPITKQRNDMWGAVTAPNSSICSCKDCSLAGWPHYGDWKCENNSPFAHSQPLPGGCGSTHCPAAWSAGLSCASSALIRTLSLQLHSSAQRCSGAQQAYWFGPEIPSAVQTVHRTVQRQGHHPAGGEAGTASLGTAAALASVRADVTEGGWPWV